jgi:hypothetical protein
MRTYRVVARVTLPLIVCRRRRVVRIHTRQMGAVLSQPRLVNQPRLAHHPGGGSSSLYKSNDESRVMT